MWGKLTKNRVLRGGALWGPKGLDRASKFSSSRGAGRGWARQTMQGGMKTPSFSPAPPRPITIPMLSLFHGSLFDCSCSCILVASCNFFLKGLTIWTCIQKCPRHVNLSSVQYGHGIPNKVYVLHRTSSPQV